MRESYIHNFREGKSKIDFDRDMFLKLLINLHHFQSILFPIYFTIQPEKYYLLILRKEIFFHSTVWVKNQLSTA